MENLGAGSRIDCIGKSTTEINAFLRQAASDGMEMVEVLNPQARHNLAVAITEPIRLIFRGHVGHYCVSLCDHVEAEIFGSAGWGVGDNLMEGEVVVHGNAASAAGPSLRGGRVVVKGNGGPRSGLGQKSGELIVGGNAGYMTGFMMQKGRIIICGNTASSLGDSMYDGAIYVGGEMEDVGNGVEILEPTREELEEIRATVAKYGIPPPKSFKKLCSDGSLHHFDKEEFHVWKEVL